MPTVIEHMSKRPPKWFRKTKTALTVLSDTAVVILLAMGYASDSLLMLCLRVGLSGLLTALQAALVEPDDDPQ